MAVVAMARELNVDIRSVSPLVLQKILIENIRYQRFFASSTPDDRDAMPFFAMVLHIKHHFMSTTFASRFSRTSLMTIAQPIDLVKKGIYVEGQIEICFHWKETSRRRPLAFYVVKDSTIDNIVDHHNKKFGGVAGAIWKPDALFSIAFMLKDELLQSLPSEPPKVRHRATRNAPQKLETRSAPVKPVPEQEGPSILSLPDEILEKICRMASTTTAGEVLVRCTHPQEEALRFLEGKDYCYKCAHSSCKRHPTWQFDTSTGLVVGPLARFHMGFFGANRRLSIISLKIFYGGNILIFYSDDDLRHFNLTAEYGRQWVESIILVDWQSMEELPRLADLPRLRVMEIWTTQPVLSTAKFLFHSPKTSFVMTLRNSLSKTLPPSETMIELRVIVFDHMKMSHRMLEDSDDSDDSDDGNE